jgi:virginiamycin B lyase
MDAFHLRCTDTRRRARFGVARRPAIEALENRALMAIGIAEFPIPGPDVSPTAITAGNDGNLWFTARQGGAGGMIGRVTPTGTIDEFPIPVAGYNPYPEFPIPNAIAAGSDNNVWFTENLFTPPFTGKIGKITPSGTITEFIVPSGAQAAGITSGPDAAMWFTEPIAGKIGRIAPGGQITEFAVPSTKWGDPTPKAITRGPDNALWFTGAGIIGRITTDGQVHDYVLPSFVPFGVTPAAAITTGPDGTLWFSNYGGECGKIATDGTLTAFNKLGFSSGSITTGSDGAAWFTNSVDRQIGRITADGTTQSAFPVPSAGGPKGITSGPGGTLWFVEVPSLDSWPGRDTQSQVGEVVLNATDAPLTLTPRPITMTAGQEFAGPLASFTDADPNGVLGDYKVTVNFTDQPMFTEPGFIVPDGKGAYNVYAVGTLNSPGPVQVTVFDTKIIGNVGGATATLTENANVVPPAILSTSYMTLTVSAAGVASAVATFDVPLGLPGGKYTATCDWGDGTPPSVGTVKDLGVWIPPKSVETLEVDGQHAYARPGTYVVHVTLLQTTDGQTASAGEIGVVKTVLPPLTASATHMTGLLAVKDAVVATFQDPGGSFPLYSFYTATIDWGDGGLPAAGWIDKPFGGPAAIGSHTYAEPGHYVIHVTISAQDGRTVSADSSADVHGTPIAVTGALTRASDSGASSGDGITNINTPTFAGSTTPGALVRVFVAQVGPPGPKLVGQAIADSHGAWSVTTSSLADGVYWFAATATAADGTTASPIVLYPASSVGPIVIATSGPRVAGVSVDLASGRIFVVLQGERANLDNLTLGNSASYRVILRFGSADHLLPIKCAVVSPPGPGGISVVALTLVGGRPLLPGRYELRIASGGVFDLAGNALDGEFTGKLPSGDGNPGGDFVALFRICHKAVIPRLLPIIIPKSRVIGRCR